MQFRMMCSKRDENNGFYNILHFWGHLEKGRSNLLKKIFSSFLVQIYTLCVFLISQNLKLLYTNKV